MEEIATSIPEHRKEDVIYFNVPDQTQPFGYNPLKRVFPEKRLLAASGILEVFKKMWTDFWGPRMEHVLRNAILALLDQEEATLPDIAKLIVDDTFRKSVARQVSNPQVREFWLKEYEKYSYRLRADAVAPIQNKVGAFLADPNLYRILTKPEKTIQVRKTMDEEKILLVNLAKGMIGEDSSGLLGGILITTISLAAFSLAELSPEERRDFYLYIDEFQNFTTFRAAQIPCGAHSRKPIPASVGYRCTAFCSW